METINGCTIVPPSETTETIHFGPEESAGAYVALIGGLPPGDPGPPLHTHPHTDEAFFVASGEGTFVLGDRELRISSGGLVFVPRGVAHTLRNDGDDPLRGLIVISPGDAEHVFLPVESS